MSNSNPASYRRHSDDPFGIHTGQPYVPQPYRRPWELPPRQWEDFPQHGSSPGLPGAEADRGSDYFLPYGDASSVTKPYWDQPASDPERQWDRLRQCPTDQPPVERRLPAFSAAAGGAPPAPCTRPVPTATAGPVFSYQPDYDGSIHGGIPGTALGEHFASILKLNPSLFQEAGAYNWPKHDDEGAVRRGKVLEAEQRPPAESQGRELYDLVREMTAGAGLPWAPTPASDALAQTAPVPASSRDPRTRASPLAPGVPGEPPRHELGVGAERTANVAARLDDSGLSRNVLEKLWKSLEDGRVYQLVARLKSEQSAREKELFEQRKLLRHQHDKRKKLAQALTGPEDALQQEEKEMEGEMRDLDMKIISELDTLLQNQQWLLEMHNVPGFFPTTDPTQLEIQAKVMAVILNKPTTA